MRTQPEQFSWTSRQGLACEFTVHEMRSTWARAPGVYLYGVRRADGTWRVLFVGHTDDLARHMPHEPNWGRAYASGATNILVCVLSNAVTREEVHTELLRATQAPLNQRLRAA